MSLCGKTNGELDMPSEFYTLFVKFEKCKNCGNCEKILPQFKSTYGGHIIVSDWAYSREDVQVGISNVLSSCSENAIEFKRGD